MNATLQCARVAAVTDAMQRTQWQAESLEQRILAAEVAGNHAEVERLRDIKDAASRSTEQYREELQRMMPQRRLAL